MTQASHVAASPKPSASPEPTQPPTSLRSQQQPQQPSDTAKAQAGPHTPGPIPGTRKNFWTSALVITLLLWSSSAPSLLYPTYAVTWNLTPLIITSIFAAYPIALLLVLLFAGGISDRIGRRAAMLTGLIFIAVSCLVFAFAPGVAFLYLGRVMQGVGTGIALGAANAAMVEFEPHRNTARASSLITVAFASGLSLGPLVTGALVQYAPLTHELSYLVLLLLVVAATALVLIMPQGSKNKGQGWRPQPVTVPRSLLGVFVVAGLAVTATYSSGALFLSLGGQIAKELVHTSNVLIASLVLAIISICIGVVGVVLRRVAPHRAVIVGGLLGAAGMLSLLATSLSNSLPLFVVTGLLAGAGGGLMFLGGMGLIARDAPAHHRARTLSAVYLVGYLGQGGAAVAAGLAATAWGLTEALDLFAPTMAVFCVLTAAIAALHLRRVRATR